MAYNPISKILLGSGSSGTADTFIGDARLISLSIQSGSNASASRYTISMSNADGFQAAIPTTSWSVVTTILGQGVYDLDPGSRWLRAERPNFAISGSSNATFLLSRYYE